MEYENLTKQIIGAAFEVHNELGFGFLESVYEEALLIALRETGLSAVSQAAIEVVFRGHPVGHFVADLLVEDTVIVELKSVRQLVTAHEVQLVNYLTATGKPIGLLLNFSESVQVKRKVRTLSAANPAHPVNPV